MSEYYDHYHRWEPLAEFNFNIDSDGDELDDENYFYCLCSRALIRDGVKTYYGDKEDGSESEAEVQRDTQSQAGDDHSHVHFSLDTSYKVKCEKDDGASCYCSASHTENCCSTDEHDAQIHGTISHALQPSDSGADLTYQDSHLEYINHDKQEKPDQKHTGQTVELENYLSEDSWDKFWAVHGERLIWASWITRYSSYINPAYLDENNDLLMDENNIPKQRSVDQIYQEPEQKDEDDMRDRKFSYDSKVNPYKKNRGTQDQNDKTGKSSDPNKDDSFQPIGRRRSCSEHERIVSPRTVQATDSMTNVTKLTISSYDISSSHVTSESSPTDDYSVSSSNSDDQSNDQTRIANIDESIEQESEEMDTEQYWQHLWKKHFVEQYALHYDKYLEKHNAHEEQIPAINIQVVNNDLITDLKLDVECENSEGNSQDAPTVIEVKTKLEQLTVEEKNSKKKRAKKCKPENLKYLGSVGVLLQNLLKEEQNKVENNETEIVEAGEEDADKKEEAPVTVAIIDGAVIGTTQKPVGGNFKSYSYDDGDDDPPEETPVSLKRSHELDEEEISSEKIKVTLETMGFALELDKMPKGQLVYKKRIGRLRPPRYKRFGLPRKTYFDDDGNPYQSDQNKEMQTDEDCADVTDIEKPTDNTPDENNSRKDKNKEPKTKTTDDNQREMENVDAVKTIDEDFNKKTLTPKDYKAELLEAASVPLPSDLDPSLSDTEGNNDEEKADVTENTVTRNTESSKRRRRPKRHSRLEGDDNIVEDLPLELRDDPVMKKYWRKRHSLFHRFDEGVRLDRESWFSVTPESVARHVARKCAHDTVLDAFCGAGGNAIQFAHTAKTVIAVDIDPVKIEMAKHNAAVYGVADRIEFIVGDFFELAPTLEADMVFLSPPWGGPSYSKNQEYDIETMLEPVPATQLMATARTISQNVTLYLPRNTKTDQILNLAKEVGGSVEIEQSFLDKRFIGITAYYY